MSPSVLCAVILLAALNFTAAQTSCKARCGTEYYRGFMCQCDYSCLAYGECCKDFESQCTTKNSCKGRCGESFKRGRLCSCDHDCVKYNQCCSDYKLHCDAEEVKGAASAPSCNVNNNKPKGTTFDEATQQSSTFSEGNNADDPLTPLDSPTSYPPDNISNDLYGQIFPSDEFSNNGVDNVDATQIPDTSSGYGATTADLLDQSSTEPTLSTDTVEFTTDSVFAQTDMTPSDDDNLSTLKPITAESPTESTDAVFTSLSDHATVEPTTPAIDQDTSSQPASTSVPEMGPSTSPPELETLGPEDDGDAVSPLDETEVVSSQLTTITVSATSDPTPTPEESTSSPNTESSSGGDVTAVTPSSPADPDYLSTTVSPEDLSELGAVTSLLPSSTAAAQDDATDSVTSTPTDSVKPTSSQTSKPQDKPHKPSADNPTSKPETKPQNTGEGRDFQGDDSNDINLCSGRPVSGVTTLRNGTMVVFRGHYFWFLDRNRVPGPARGITAVWGVPSPIDTVFTRCNCQGKTYIFKGGQYWRFENDVLDPGYPKVVETGFDGLQGHITAALSVPQYQRRRESVYFFKRGGNVQKYSYQYGTSPTCGRKVQYAIYTVRNRIARQAVSLLEPAINIRTAWRGFPTTVTAAVSIPTNREPEGYKYVVFSRSKSYNVRMDGARPVITTPTANAAPQANNFFNCPKKV